MDDLDGRVAALLKELMLHCKLERKTKTSTSGRALAAELGITENYLSSIENGRVFPSLKVFLRYLLINRFNTDPLAQLAITNVASQSDEVGAKTELINKIYSLDDKAVSYLAEQERIYRGINRRKTKKR